jgi:spore maturation protein CgeB
LLFCAWRQWLERLSFAIKRPHPRSHLHARAQRLQCNAACGIEHRAREHGEHGFSPATRIFEAAGAGACIITDAWEGIEMFLEPGTEVLVARDGLDVAHHLKALTPKRARSIGEAALRRVRAEHTYEERGAQADETLRRAAAFKRERAAA